MVGHPTPSKTEEEPGADGNGILVGLSEGRSLGYCSFKIKLSQRILLARCVCISFVLKRLIAIKRPQRPWMKARPTPPYCPPIQGFLQGFSAISAEIRLEKESSVLRGECGLMSGAQRTPPETRPSTLNKIVSNFLSWPVNGPHCHSPPPPPPPPPPHTHTHTHTHTHAHHYLQPSSRMRPEPSTPQRLTSTIALETTMVTSIAPEAARTSL
jgi:hypothetical protein